MKDFCHEALSYPHTAISARIFEGKFSIPVARFIYLSRAADRLGSVEKMAALVALSKAGATKPQ